jgi:hypothetical protein
MPQRGNTALHLSVQSSDRLAMCRHLVEHGAKIHAKNEASGCASCCRTRISHAFINPGAQAGDTPALLAARGRQWRLMHYLVSVGADITEKDEVRFRRARPPSPWSV